MAEGSQGPALLKEDEKGGGARTALSLSPLLLARIPLPVGACVQPAGAHPKGAQALDQYELPGPALLLRCRSRLKRDGVWRRANSARRATRARSDALINGSPFSQKL